MWSTLPLDILSNIFSFLPPHSLAIATLTCKTWHSCVKACPSSTTNRPCPAWFIAFPALNCTSPTYAHNPMLGRWHELSLDFLPEPARPVGPIGSLLLFEPKPSGSLQLALCNPFTRQPMRCLPVLNVARTKPAVGVVELAQGGPFPHFRIYVAGGMREAAPLGGATYEPTAEMYDSRCGEWRRAAGTMPVEFAVRLTVWTPSGGVCCGSALYWITSYRAYTIVRYELAGGAWRELGVPMADRMGFAALVRRNGRATLVGGTCDGEVLVWELGEGDMWVLVETLPDELGRRLLGVRGTTKCVGDERAVWLYRDLRSGMVVWRELVGEGRWEWIWVEGCRSMKGKEAKNCSVKGVILRPALAHSFTLGN